MANFKLSAPSMIKYRRMLLLTFCECRLHAEHLSNIKVCKINVILSFSSYWTHWSRAGLDSLCDMSRKWQKCFPVNLCFVQVLVYWYDTNQFYHFPTWPHRHWHWPVYPWQWPDPDTVATTGDLTHTTASRMVTFNTYHKGESAKIYET